MYLTIEMGESAFDPHITLFRLKGILDSMTVPELEIHFVEQFRSSRVRWIMDFEDLEYISSAGLKSFVGAVPELRDHGGDICFVNLPSQLGNIFKTKGVGELFKVFASEADAVRALQRV
jgi:anti-anti-sigma factor